MLNKLVLQLGFLHDLIDYHSMLHSKLALVVISLTLGLGATLGFAPYNLWVITIVSLTFEFFFIGTLKNAKQVFCSLLIYFTALNASTLEWLNFVMNGFGDLPLPIAWAIEILFATYLAVFHALFGAIAFRAALRLIRAKQTDIDHASSVSTVAPAPAPAPAASTPSQSTAMAAATANKDTATAKQSEIDHNANENDNEDEDTDEDYDDAMPQRGIAALKAARQDDNDDYPEPSKGEIIAALDSIKPDLPGGMPSMFSQSLTLPVLTSKNGQKLRFYKHVYLLCFLPLALILADLLIGWLLTGFPWMYIGYIAVEGPFSSYAPWFGVRGISLVIFVCAGALALSLDRRFLYLPIAAILFLLGVFFFEVRYTSDLPAIKVAGVQGAIPQSIKWDPRHTKPTIEKYVNLTMEYFGKSDLIVWPESAIPIFAQQIMPLLRDINIHATATGSPIFIGIQHYITLPPSDEASDTAATDPTAAANSTPQAGSATTNTAAATIPNTTSAATNSEASTTLEQPTAMAATATETGSPVTLTASADTSTATTANTSQDIATNNTSAASAAHAANAINNVTTSKTQEPQVYELVSDASGHATTVPAHKTEHATVTAVKHQRLYRQSFNSIFLLGQGEDFSTVQIYDKRKLVPFGEVVPFAQYTRDLGALFNFPMSSFTSGAAAQKQMYLQDKDLYFLPAICYESIFPEAIAALHDEHTNAILMVSNDSWFGSTRGPQEHLAIARMRTIEMQKPMLRITNSGISAYIDALGKIKQQLPQEEAAVLYGDFIPAKGTTPYMLWGNIPLYGILLLLGALGCFLRTRDEDIRDQHLQELVRP